MKSKINKKENWIKIFALFIICMFMTSGISINSIAQDEEEKKWEDMSVEEKFQSNPEEAIDEIYKGTISPDDPKIPPAIWDQIDQSKIQDIAKIPAQYVDVNKVKDQSKLTATQLIYEDNLENIGDLKDLNSDAMNQAFHKKGLVPESVTIVVRGGNKLKKRENIFVLLNQGRELNLNSIPANVISVVAVGPEEGEELYPGFVFLKEGESLVVVGDQTLKISFDEQGKVDIQAVGRSIKGKGNIKITTEGDITKIRLESGIEVSIKYHQEGTIIDADGNKISLAGAHTLNVKVGDNEYLSTVFTNGAETIIIEDNKAVFDITRGELTVKNTKTGLVDKYSGYFSVNYVDDVVQKFELNAKESWAYIGKFKERTTHVGRDVAWSSEWDKNIGNIESAITTVNEAKLRLDKVKELKQKLDSGILELRIENIIDNLKVIYKTDNIDIDEGKLLINNKDYGEWNLKDIVNIAQTELENAQADQTNLINNFKKSRNLAQDKTIIIRRDNQKIGIGAHKAETEIKGVNSKGIEKTLHDLLDILYNSESGHETDDLSTIFLVTDNVRQADGRITRQISVDNPAELEPGTPIYYVTRQAFITVDGVERSFEITHKITREKDGDHVQLDRDAILFQGDLKGKKVTDFFAAENDLVLINVKAGKEVHHDISKDFVRNSIALKIDGKDVISIGDIEQRAQQIQRLALRYAILPEEVTKKLAVLPEDLINLRGEELDRAIEIATAQIGELGEFAQNLVKAGDLAIEGKTIEAIQEYKKIAEETPNLDWKTMALNFQAQFQEQIGDIFNAKKTYEEIVDVSDQIIADPAANLNSKRAAHQNKINALISLENEQAYTKALEEYFENIGKDVYYYQILGNLNARENRLDDAIANYKAILGLDIDARTRLAVETEITKLEGRIERDELNQERQKALEEGDLNKAREIGEKIKSKFGESVYDLIIKSNILSGLDQNPEARRSLFEAEDLINRIARETLYTGDSRRDLSHIYSGLGNIDLKEKNYGDSIDNFEQALKFNPTNLNALNGKATAHELQKEYDQALESFKLARELLDPVKDKESIAWYDQKIDSLQEFIKIEKAETIEELAEIRERAFKEGDIGLVVESSLKIADKEEDLLKTKAELESAIDFLKKGQAELAKEDPTKKDIFAKEITQLEEKLAELKEPIREKAVGYLTKESTESLKEKAILRVGGDQIRKEIEEIQKELKELDEDDEKYTEYYMGLSKDIRELQTRIKVAKEEGKEPDYGDTELLADFQRKKKELLESKEAFTEDYLKGLWNLEAKQGELAKFEKGINEVLFDVSRQAEALSREELIEVKESLREELGFARNDVWELEKKLEETKKLQITREYSSYEKESDIDTIEQQIELAKSKVSMVVEKHEKLDEMVDYKSLSDEEFAKKMQTLNDRYKKLNEVYEDKSFWDIEERHWFTLWLTTEDEDTKEARLATQEAKRDYEKVREVKKIRDLNQVGFDLKIYDQGARSAIRTVILREETNELDNKLKSNNQLIENNQKIIKDISYEIGYYRLELEEQPVDEFGRPISLSEFIKSKEGLIEELNEMNEQAEDENEFLESEKIKTTLSAASNAQAVLSADLSGYGQKEREYMQATNLLALAEGEILRSDLSTEEFESYLKYGSDYSSFLSGTMSVIQIPFIGATQAWRMGKDYLGIEEGSIIGESQKAYDDVFKSKDDARQLERIVKLSEESGVGISDLTGMIKNEDRTGLREALGDNAYATHERIGTFDTNNRFIDAMKLDDKGNINMADLDLGESIVGNEEFFERTIWDNIFNPGSLLMMHGVSKGINWATARTMTFLGARQAALATAGHTTLATIVGTGVKGITLTGKVLGAPYTASNYIEGVVRAGASKVVGKYIAGKISYGLSELFIEEVVFEAIPYFRVIKDPLELIHGAGHVNVNVITNFLTNNNIDSSAVYNPNYGQIQVYNAQNQDQMRKMYGTLFADANIQKNYEVTPLANDEGYLYKPKTPDLASFAISSTGTDFNLNNIMVSDSKVGASEEELTIINDVPRGSDLTKVEQSLGQDESVINLETHDNYISYEQIDIEGEIKPAIVRIEGTPASELTTIKGVNIKSEISTNEITNAKYDVKNTQDIRNIIQSIDPSAVVPKGELLFTNGNKNNLVLEIKADTKAEAETIESALEREGYSNIRLQQDNKIITEQRVNPTTGQVDTIAINLDPALEINELEVAEEKVKVIEKEKPVITDQKQLVTNKGETINQVVVDKEFDVRKLIPSAAEIEIDEDFSEKSATYTIEGKTSVLTREGEAPVRRVLGERVVTVTESVEQSIANQIKSRRGTDLLATSLESDVEVMNIEEAQKKLALEIITNIDKNPAAVISKLREIGIIDGEGNLDEAFKNPIIENFVENYKTQLQETSEEQDIEIKENIMDVAEIQYKDKLIVDEIIKRFGWELDVYNNNYLDKEGNIIDTTEAENRINEYLNAFKELEIGVRLDTEGNIEYVQKEEIVSKEDAFSAVQESFREIPAPPKVTPFRAPPPRVTIEEIEALASIVETATPIQIFANFQTFYEQGILTEDVFRRGLEAPEGERLNIFQQQLTNEQIASIAAGVRITPDTEGDFNEFIKPVPIEVPLLEISPQQLAEWGVLEKQAKIREFVKRAREIKPGITDQEIANLVTRSIGEEYSSLVNNIFDEAVVEEEVKEEFEGILEQVQKLEIGEELEEGEEFISDLRAKIGEVMPYITTDPGEVTIDTKTGEIVSIRRAEIEPRLEIEPGQKIREAIEASESFRIIPQEVKENIKSIDDLVELDFDLIDYVSDQMSSIYLAYMLGEPAVSKISYSEEGKITQGSFVHDRKTYSLERILGTPGGFGTVWEASVTEEEQSLGKVAVKFTNPDLSLRQKISTLREAAIIKQQMEQPQGIDKNAGYLAQDQYFVVMDLYEGKDGLEVILEQGPLTLTQTLNLGLISLEQLAEMHSEGMLHNDFKPANMMIKDVNALNEPAIEKLQKDNIKLIDYGLVLPVGADAQNIIPFSPYYVSPKTVIDGVYDEETDLFAFGASLYEFLTGENIRTEEEAQGLTKGENPEQVYDKVISKEIWAGKDVPQELQSFINSLLLHEFSTAQEALDEFIKIRESLIEAGPEEVLVIEVPQGTRDFIEQATPTFIQANFQAANIPQAEIDRAIENPQERVDILLAHDVDPNLLLGGVVPTEEALRKEEEKATYVLVGTGIASFATLTFVTVMGGLELGPVETATALIAGPTAVASTYLAKRMIVDPIRNLFTKKEVEVPQGTRDFIEQATPAFIQANFEAANIPQAEIDRAIANPQERVDILLVHDVDPNLLLGGVVPTEEALREEEEKVTSVLVGTGIASFATLTFVTVMGGLELGPVETATALIAGPTAVA
ncbi:protein kinase, partial [Candidatus Woesearchaeota archaeon]|nr:protein kinase [Candidatus Woesearchaeota archaeon]